MQYGIQIDIHQIQEVLVIPAGNRVDGFIGIGHRIQEGLKRALKQIHERFPHRILSRSVQYGMFTDMKDTAVIFRNGFEANTEGLVFIRPFQPDKSCAGLLMNHLIKRAAAVRRILHTGYQEAPDAVIHVNIHCFLISCPLTVYHMTPRNRPPAYSRVTMGKQVSHHD